jgi:hypothetical protein
MNRKEPELALLADLTKNVMAFPASQPARTRPTLSLQMASTALIGFAMISRNTGRCNPRS